jgi:hypothetical protein
MQKIGAIDKGLEINLRLIEFLSYNFSKISGKIVNGTFYSDNFFLTRMIFLRGMPHDT